MTSTTTIYREPEQDGAVLWAGAPDVATLTRALVAVDRALRAVEQRPAATVPTAAQLADVLELGGDPFESLADRIDAELRDTDIRDREMRLLRDTRQHLADRLAQYQRDNVDTALAVLAGSLADVVEKTRVLLPKLRNVFDSDDAIRADRADEWQRFAALTARHGRIRATQVRLVGDAIGDRHAAVRLVEKAGRVGNVEDFEPLRSRIEHGEDRTTRPNVGAHVTRAATPDTPPAYSDGHAYLRWLTRDDVQPWVPSIAELRRKATSIDRAIAEADEARARRVTPDEARRDRDARRAGGRVRTIPTTFGP